MSIQAAKLFANVSVTGGAATSAALRGVGGEVTAAQSAMSKFSGVGGVASKALGVVERGAGGVGSAFNHLKGTMGGLISGPLGFLGLGAGVLGLGGALKSGIDTASGMALALEKLTALTGESAQAMSGLMAVTGKYGVSSDQLSTIVGFEEKTVGKLAETTGKATKAGKSAALQSLENIKLKDQETGASTKVIDKLIAEQKARDALAAATGAQALPLNKLQALQKQYGVTLTDSTGKALDFSTILNHVSDYYNSNATQGQKAALAATLFGRGYAALIPVLQLGSAGFAEAQSAAEALGLTLTSQNATDLKNYQETMRNLGDAVGGLQLQLSLALVPALKDVATAATAFIGQNRNGIVEFFKTLITDARSAAGFLTGTIIPDLQSLAGAAIGFWNSIPGPLKDILVKGFIADRAMKFLFGFDPATAIGSIIAKQLLGGLASGLGDVLKKGLGAIGGSVASKVAGGVAGALDVQKVFVVNMGAGGLGGAAGGAATGAEEAAGGIGIASIAVAAAAVVAGAIAAVLAIKFAQDNAAVVDLGNKVVAQTQTYIASNSTSAADIQASLDGINAQEGGLLNGIALNLTNGFNGGKDKLDAIKAGLQARLDQMVALGDRTDKSADHIAASTAAFAPDQQKTIGRLAASEHADAAAQTAAISRAIDHASAIADIKKVDGSIHNLLTTFRSGGAKVAINDFARELAYLSTASDAQKKTAVYSSGIRQDITALQHAEVGATGAQKVILSNDIRKLQALADSAKSKAAVDAARHAALLVALNSKSVTELTRLQEIKDKDSSVSVTTNFNVSADRIAQAVIKLRSGVSVT